MCVSWRSVALQFAKLCLPKPLPLLLGTGRTPRTQTRLQVPTQSAHPPKYPHRRPTTLICCATVDLRLHRREKFGGSRKSSCRRRRTRRTRGLQRDIGGPTRMVCGCKHFDLVVRFTSFSCKMRACACILPILCVVEEDGIAFDGPQPWHINWYDGLDKQQRHQLQHQAQRKEEGRRSARRNKDRRSRRPMELGMARRTSIRRPIRAMAKGIENEHLADNVGTASPSSTPPGTPKHSPQPRTEAEGGMHRYAPLHHGTCYVVPFVHRQPLFAATMEQRSGPASHKRRRSVQNNGAEEEGL